MKYPGIQLLRAELPAYVFNVGGLGVDFVFFNDVPLSDEPISDADIIPIQLDPRSKYSTQTWSCGCGWYFVVTEAGIVLGQPMATEGRLCLKKSWRFIEAFVERPAPKRKSHT